ncbi:PH domain-containing protein [Actinacidiphila guanduensis]|uniref:PH domain-containing protein n=1 Tax=Actinacidiphila guanduensis TaxID=310781 RepID=A0A1H0B542_9ACTN|nr:PH domain-containing protein [Actinacidiphila guanduensis]SDN40724.1 PH domain-containing protein [Actinacidiphila guanduensis]
MRFLVKLVFDERGVTIQRVVRRRRFAWADIAGLVYSERRSGVVNGPPTYHLRLVLRGQEPPLGRFLTQVQRQDYCNGPVLMALATLDDDGESKGDHQRRRVLEELARHGFPAPAARPWEFRTPRFSARAVTAAVAMDLRGTHAVAVRHGAEVSAEEEPLLARTLPELAAANGGADTTLREPDFVSFFFEDPAAADDAAAFLAAAREVVPSHWGVTPGTLPADDGPPSGSAVVAVPRAVGPAGTAPAAGPPAVEPDAR